MAITNINSIHMECNYLSTFPSHHFYNLLDCYFTSLMDGFVLQFTMWRGRSITDGAAVKPRFPAPVRNCVSSGSKLQGNSCHYSVGVLLSTLLKNVMPFGLSDIFVKICLVAMNHKRHKAVTQSKIHSAYERRIA